MKVSIDAKGLLKKLDAQQKHFEKSVFRGTVSGLNKIAFSARKNYQEYLEKKGASKFTKRGVLVKKVRYKRNIEDLQAFVYIKPEQFKYLKRNIEGGTQTFTGRRAIIALPPLRGTKKGKGTKIARDNFENYQKLKLKPAKTKKGNLLHYVRAKQAWRGGQKPKTGTPFAVLAPKRTYQKTFKFIPIIKKRYSAVKDKYIYEQINYYLKK